MPSKIDFNAVCYLKRYPDLNTIPSYDSRPAKSGMSYDEQIGWMFKSSDGTWHYGRTNGRELKRIKDDPYWHYLNFGIKEGRVGGCDTPDTRYSLNFNADAYLSRYPDVAGKKSGIKPSFVNDPVGHWNAIGKKEGRIPGYELLTRDLVNGEEIVNGTFLYATPENIAEDQAAKLASSEQANEGANVSTGSDKSKLILILGVVGLGSYFLFRKKRK